MGSKYSSTTVSSFNASPPSDDGSTASTNKVQWSTIKTKLADPLNTFASAVNSALVTAFDYSARLVTSADSTVAGDHMRTIQVPSSVTTTFTISLADAATMANGYIVRIKNNSAINITVGRATSGDTIDGVAANRVLPAGASIIFAVNANANGYNVMSAVGTAKSLVISGQSIAPPDEIGLPSGSDTLRVVAADALDAGFLLDCFGTSVNARIFGRKARGTNASKTAIQSGDNIIAVEAQGHDGSAYNTDYRALISLRAAENWTTSAHGTDIHFEITPTGSTTPQTVCNMTEEGIIALASGNAARGGKVQNTDTGASAYSLTYYGDSVSATTALIGVVGSGNSAYGGARSMVFGTNVDKPVVCIANNTEITRASSSGYKVTGLFDISAATSGQIKFPSAQNSSADANTLDDYEEGTWTPVIAGESTAGTQTYSAQVGRYTKIGRVVYIQATVTLSAAGGTINGNVIVTGLPFTSENATDVTHGASVGYYSNVNLSAGQTQMSLYIPANAAVARFVEMGDNTSAANVQATALSASTDIHFSAFYNV